MCEPLKTNSAQLVEQARRQITEVDTPEAIAMAEQDDVVVVDLRDIRERERSGFIPGSFHCPRGMAEFWVDPQSPYYKSIFGRDATFLFHCASGWRSAITVLTLQNMGMEKVAHFREVGYKFGEWLDVGYWQARLEE